MTRRLVFAVKWIASDGTPDLATFSTREAAEGARPRLLAPQAVTLHMVGDDPPPKKLTAAQRAFLLDMVRNGCSIAPGGFPGAGLRAAAWYRTADALADRGLVKRHGGRAVYTWRGLAVTVALEA